MRTTSYNVTFRLDTFSCGASAVSSCLHKHGVVVPPRQIAKLLPHRKGLNTYSDLAKAVTDLGYSQRGVRWDNEIPNKMLPAVLRLEVYGSSDHFVAAISGDQNTVLIDNFGSLKRLTFDELRKQGWDGTALHIGIRAFSGANESLPASYLPSRNVQCVLFLIAIIAYPCFLWIRRPSVPRIQNRGSSTRTDL